MVRLLYGIVLGLVGAAIVHLAIVLLLPFVSTSTAWTQVSGRVEPGQIVELNAAQDSQTLAGIAPYERAFVCRYDLSQGITRMTAAGQSPVWSLSVQSALGEVLFSTNDRIVGQDRIDIAIANDRQLRNIRQTLPEELIDSVIVSTGSTDGFILVRIMEFDASWTPVSDELIASASCGPLQAPV